LFLFSVILVKRERESENHTNGNQERRMTRACFVEIGYSSYKPCCGKKHILFTSYFIRFQRFCCSNVQLSTRKPVISASGETVVVFGGSGRLGRRVVGELVKQNYRVAVGGRNLERTKRAVQERIDTTQYSNLLEYFEWNVNEQGRWFERWSSDTVKAVVAVIGASGKSLLDVTQPYKIDYLGNRRLVDATRSWNPNCPFILVTSLGTGKPFTGFPAALLNLYGGILYWKGQSEKYLIQSGLPFTSKLLFIFCFE